MIGPFVDRLTSRLDVPNSRNRILRRFSHIDIDFRQLLRITHVPLDLIPQRSLLQNIYNALIGSGTLIAILLTIVIGLELRSWGFWGIDVIYFAAYGLLVIVILGIIDARLGVVRRAQQEDPAHPTAGLLFAIHYLRSLNSYAVLFTYGIFHNCSCGTS